VNQSGVVIAEQKRFPAACFFKAAKTEARLYAGTARRAGREGLKAFLFMG
jgi:hypothetical protein